MELSMDVKTFEQFNVVKRRNEEYMKSEPSSSISHLDTISDTIIDVNKINFSSDETWLYEPQDSPDITPVNIKSWLHYENNEDFTARNSTAEDDSIVPDAEKIFDSRTFTRPKKRFSRPSIEKYNEALYGKDNEYSLPESPRRTTAENTLNKCEEEPYESSPSRPLSFDLTQPSTSYYFEKLASAPEIDSFQNMSPPSLVNSMCSSTFTTLMENSYIKNDPLLREIRDTDFTETILLQDSEPPMFHSITESCSSMNSDTPESFLKKLSITGSFRKSVLKDSDDSGLKGNLNSTFSMDKSTSTPGIMHRSSQSEMDSDSHETDTSSSTPTTVTHGTYKRPSKYATYRKSDVKRNSSVLDSTFNVSSGNSTFSTSQDATDSPNQDVLNATITIESPKLKRRFEKSQAQRREALEIIKQQQENLDTTFVSESNHITDSNRLSYYDEKEKFNATITKDDDSYIKRRSILENHDEEDRFNPTREDSGVLNNKSQSLLASSTGSADSLDRMSSSLSNSSRGSSRMLNMAEVDAIVERQEKSLHIMSTPKPRNTVKKLWENNCISPITVSEPYSDSDQSSNDDFRSARSQFSTHANQIKNAKSLNYIPAKQELKRPNLKNVNTISSGRNLESMANTFRGSYTNLKSAVNGCNGSQPQLNKIGNSLRGSQSNLRAKGSQSNLKTVGSTLRGSYTSLKPLTAVSLPVAPPPRNNTTITTKPANFNGTYVTAAKQANLNGTYVSSTKPANLNGTFVCGKGAKIAEVPPIPREIPGDSQFSKPAPPQGDGQFIKPAVPRMSAVPRPLGTGIPRPVSSRIPGPRKTRPSSLYQPRHTGEGY